jgi:hypothetical protein
MAKKKAATITSPDGRDMQAVLKDSIQKRFEERPLSETFGTWWWFGKRAVEEDEISEWWSS